MDKQVNELEEERSEIGNKVYALGIALSDYYIWIEFKKTKKQLDKENKHSTDFDIILSILNKQQIKYANKNDWGLCRCTCYSKYAILKAEKRFKDALEAIMEVCYYDINGATNLSKTDLKFSDRKKIKNDIEYVKQNWGLFRNPDELNKMQKKLLEDLEKEEKILLDYYYNKSRSRPPNISLLDDFLQPFDIRNGNVYSSTIADIEYLKEKLNLQWEGVKTIFIERATKIRIEIMPVSPEMAWEILYEKLQENLGKG